jgi:hypothetical protein
MREVQDLIFGPIHEFYSQKTHYKNAEISGFWGILRDFCKKSVLTDIYTRKILDCYAWIAIITYCVVSVDCYNCLLCNIGAENTLSEEFSG